MPNPSFLYDLDSWVIINHPTAAPCQSCGGTGTVVWTSQTGKARSPEVCRLCHGLGFITGGEPVQMPARIVRRTWSDYLSGHGHGLSPQISYMLRVLLGNRRSDGDFKEEYEILRAAQPNEIPEHDYDREEGE